MIVTPSHIGATASMRVPMRTSASCLSPDGAGDVSRHADSSDKGG